ncbi:MAG: hypothetical protein ACHQ4H_05935 [Ktedonobacterales bacterium]
MMHTTRTGRQWLFVSRLFVSLAAIVLVATGCDAAAPRRQQTSAPNPKIQQVINGQHLAAPPCGPALATASVGQTGLQSVLMPANAHALVGFNALVPTHIPDNVTWNFVFVEAVPTAGQPTVTGRLAPLLHIGYRVASSGLKVFTSPPPSIIALDETTAHLEAATALYPTGGMLRVGAQSSVTIGTSQGTLSQLSGPGGGRTTTLMWHAGTLTLRLAVTTVGQLRVFPWGRPPTSYEPTIDTLDAWTQASDTELIAMAQSLSAYTGCGHA